MQQFNLVFETHLLFLKAYFLKKLIFKKISSRQKSIEYYPVKNYPVTSLLLALYFRWIYFGEEQSLMVVRRYIV